MKRSVEVSTEVRAGLTQVRDVLFKKPASVLVESSTAQERSDRRLHTSLSVEIRPGTRVGHAMEMDVGIARLDSDGLSLPLSWRGVGRSSLYPSFEGEIAAARSPTGSRLVLRGSYEVPMGFVGTLGDGAGGKRLAEGSLESYLTEVAGRLQAEVERDNAALPRAPARPPEDLREAHPENYSG